jgi:riboflavin kinase/FMN adenylyltransferase
MEIIRGEHNIRPRHQHCVATIGNFDGVHRGHQAVIAALIDKARQNAAQATVVLFEPQPAEYFARAAPPARLTRLREKAQLLAALGVDQLLVLPFDQHMASRPADVFVRQCLIDGLAIRGLIVGDDFKFGSHRSGDFLLLQRFAETHGFTIDRAESFIEDGERVSSTSIRALLRDGQLREVLPLLGRRYFISGRVVHGQKKGREMGFATANIDLHRLASPLHGIFASEVRGLGARPLPAISYIGYRPIVNGTKAVLEVHLFDFDEDVYGRYLQVDFVEKIRDDLPFTDFEALSRQIALDCAAARRALAQA